MKKLLLSVLTLLLLFSCKSFFKSPDTGNFLVINYSDKAIEFVWIAPEGELFPTAKAVNIEKNGKLEINGLKEGRYDIALDFKGEYNSINSKKDKSLVLTIERGLTAVWTVEPSGSITRN